MGEGLKRAIRAAKATRTKPLPTASPCDHARGLAWRIWSGHGRRGEVWVRCDRCQHVHQFTDAQWADLIGKADWHQQLHARTVKKPSVELPKAVPTEQYPQ